MALKLADAYVELRARTEQHDRAINGSTEKLKLFGVESAKVQALSTKMFLAIGLGAGSAMAVIGKVANLISSLGAALLKAAKEGETFGNAINRWAKEVTGLDNAVTRLDARMKAQNEASKARAAGERVEFGASGFGAIPGLSPERAAELSGEQATRQIALQQAQAGAVAARRRLKEFANPDNVSAEVSEGIRAADQEVVRAELHIKQLADTIKEEISIREANIKAMEFQRQVSERIGFNAEHAGRLLGGGIEGAAGGLNALLAPLLGEQRPGEHFRRSGAMGRGAGGEAEIVDDLTKAIETAILNADPVALGHLPQFTHGKQKQAAQMMGAQEFASGILRATASQDPERDMRRQQAEHIRGIDDKLRIQNELLKHGAPATFAAGEAVA